MFGRVDLLTYATKKDMNMTANVLLTAPAVEPVSLAEMKSFARVGTTADDDLMTSLIKASRQWCEKFTGRAFISQTWRLWVSFPPKKREIILPRAPLVSLTQILFYNAQDQSSEWDEDNIFVDAASILGRIVLKDSAVWPQFQRSANSMMIDYVAGYGDLESDVPQALKIAIMQLALHWYENREAVLSNESAYRVPLTVEALLQSYRIYNVGGSCV
ncbi:MAG TPA: hypothetical protein DD400_05500 [Rhodospirillaceae bacterium]|nr:hypothetical protein [Rhodospirillaceae bacterium]